MVPASGRGGDGGAVRVAVFGDMGTAEIDGAFDKNEQVLEHLYYVTSTSVVVLHHSSTAAVAAAAAVAYCHLSVYLA